MDRTYIIAHIDEEIKRLQQARSLLTNDTTVTPSVNKKPIAQIPSRKGRKMSAAARAKISAAQKARWAKQKGGKKN